MSKQSYIDGFRKAAEARNVDPEALAKYLMSKKAEGEATTGLWDQVRAAIGDAKKWWDDPANVAYKPLIGAGIGSALGTGLGAALHGKKGLRGGAILGALGGGLGTVDWEALNKALGSMKHDAEQRSKNQQDVKKGQEGARKAMGGVKPGDKGKSPAGSAIARM